jgi:DeoR/GlpR family transcriptional regulator of sugar metabolism
MHKVGRKQEILGILNKQKTAQVNQLSELLQVSLATIRRDLNGLESEGLVERVHGGVVITSDQTEQPILQRNQQQATSKRRIGEAAARLVNDGDTIILTSGTTVEAMVPFLVAKTNLTVITNAVNVAYRLTGYPQISVIVLGGWLRHTEFSLLGHFTEQALQDLRADTIFHGIYGIHPEYGLTSTDVQEVQTDRQIFHGGQKLVILADHTKFFQTGRIRLAPVEIASMVVTDMETPEVSILALRARGVQVIQA